MVFSTIFHELMKLRSLNVKLYLNVHDAIHANEQTKHANCVLHGTFGSFLLMSFCFKMKMDYFNRKLLLWPQVPFMGFNLCRSSVPSPNYSLMPPVSTTSLQLKIRKITFRRPPIIKTAFSWWKGRN